MHRVLFVLIALSLLLVLAGCQSVRVGGTTDSGSGTVTVSQPVPHPRSDPGPGHGPPDHAPAHGRRAKYNYRYYVNLGVYFDLHRKLYFYRSSGEWVVTLTLPPRRKIAKDEIHVEIELDTALPYEKHEKVSKKHPPTKKNNQGKGEEKGKGKGKGKY